MKFPWVSILRVVIFSSVLIAVFMFTRLNPKFMILSNKTENEIVTDFSTADNETGFPDMIVPNIIHLVHFGKPQLDFGEVITIKSAHQNHKPDQIIIHCDCHSLTGEYWNMVKDIPNLKIEFKEKPKTIFGKNVTWIQHSSDIARIEVLMKYGGIYLDSDVYVVKSLDKYRKFEYAVGWDFEQWIGNQIQIAHKDARFLKLYYDSYRDYRGHLWYFNGGDNPTNTILNKQPNLIHRVPIWFGNDMKFYYMLYRQRTSRWRNFSTIHLLLRHRREHPKEFNMKNIRTYDKTFGDMARELLFGSTDFV